MIGTTERNTNHCVVTLSVQVSRGLLRTRRKRRRRGKKKKRVARRWEGVPATDTIEDRNQRRTSTTSNGSPPRLKIFLRPSSSWDGARQSLGWSPCGGAGSQSFKVPVAFLLTPCTRVKKLQVKKVQSTVLPCVLARSRLSTTPPSVVAGSSVDCTVQGRRDSI